MFLKQVGKHSKGLAFAMVVFIAAQVFINYKRGIVVSPFYSYGMYSEVINVRNSYGIFEVVQNGKRLRGQDFTPEQWDQIMLPLQYFADINKSNSLYETDVKRLLGKLHISTSDKDFISACNYQQFEKWYRNYLAAITNEQTNSLEVNYRTCLYQANKLTETAAAITLAQLCR